MTFAKGVFAWLWVGILWFFVAFFRHHPLFLWFLQQNCELPIQGWLLPDACSTPPWSQRSLPLSCPCNQGNVISQVLHIIYACAVQHIWKFCTWVIGASPRWSIVKLMKWEAAVLSETPSNNTVYANQQTKRGKGWGTNYTDVLYLHWTKYIGCARFLYNYFPMPWFMHRPLSIVTMLCSLSFAPHPKSF